MRHHAAVSFVALGLAGIVTGCAASTAELKRAHDAHYHGPAVQLYMAAARAVDHKHYPLDVADPDHGTLTTATKVYSETGTMDAPGAGGIYDSTGKRYSLSFQVRVVAAGEHDEYAIDVEPTMKLLVAGRPNADALALDDPSLPGWLHGRVDELTVEIHDELADYEIPAAPR
jgi:hypothetical protein